jgi:hypothetical protein
MVLIVMRRESGGEVKSVNETMAEWQPRRLLIPDITVGSLHLGHRGNPQRLLMIC